MIPARAPYDSAGDQKDSRSRIEPGFALKSRGRVARGGVDAPKVRLSSIGENRRSGGN